MRTGVEHGVLITNVALGSPASLAGLQSEDVIVEADRRRVTSVADLEQTLAKAKDKSQVLLRVTRRGGSLFVVIGLQAPTSRSEGGWHDLCLVLHRITNSGACAMSKSGVVTFVLSALSLSCATSPGQHEARATPQPKPVVAAPAPVAEAIPQPAATVTTKPKLQAGHCEESFDCVDTVGFPPSGYRWSCDDGKCGRVKLPNLGGEQPSAAEEDSTAVAGKAKAKSSKRRRQAN